MVIRDEKYLWQNLGISTDGGTMHLHDVALFKQQVDDIVDTLILGQDPAIVRNCRWILWEVSRQLGIYPASIYHLYKERSRKNSLTTFTVPAVNLRTLTYLEACVVFKVAQKYNAGAFIFEIAQSEIVYTAQHPQEYTAVILAAAIKEDYRGPIFMQADHTQVNAKQYYADAARQLGVLKEAITEAVAAGFYNIDIDSSTLVDLRAPSSVQQQRLNFSTCAELTQFIRQIQPKGIMITVGGEIGEVGGKNSTPQELEAFMQGYASALNGCEGISKISIQTGTTHGGVVLPDGSIAKVNIDFDTIRALSQLARVQYGLGGCVQHGASTLPHEAFHKFPAHGCCEIHLATQFQNIVYEYLPIPLKEKMYSWIQENCRSEKKPEQTEEQFIYTARKKALGPFKKEIHSVPRDLKRKIFSVLEAEFDFLFNQLNIHDTRTVVDAVTPLVMVVREKESFFREEKNFGLAEGAD